MRLAVGWQRFRYGSTLYSAIMPARMCSSKWQWYIHVPGNPTNNTSLIGGDKKRFDELHDRIAYAIVPFAAYGLLVLGGVLLLRHPQRGLTLVAVGMLSLLAVAIRNSWAIAVTVVSTPPKA
jgi:hypothetical protein